MGVSHPALEAVKAKTATYGLQTKLTGAGGGGCAVTLVPDSMYYSLHDLPLIDGVVHTRTDFSEEKLRQVVDDLNNEGFEVYLTSVGGSGVGVLSPYAAMNKPSAYLMPAIPLETSSENAEEQEHEYVNQLKVPFESQSITELPSWAEQRGRWLFV